MATTGRCRRRRWLRVAFNIGFWGFVVVGTITTVPALIRDGGWLAVAACAAWSYGCAAVVTILFLVHALRWAKVDRLGAVIAIASLFLMLLAPPVTAATLYSVEAAGGAAYLAILSGWGTLAVFGLRASRKLERDAFESERFRARFKEGPIGNWRGVRFVNQDVEQGCRIAFSADGSGHYWLRDNRDAERSADSVHFHWKLTQERLIEVVSRDEEAGKRLEFFVGYYAGPTAKLMFNVPGIQWPERSACEISYAEFDKISWPRFVVFDYVGEPASGATPSKSPI
jgi:hypothetical protein